MNFGSGGGAAGGLFGIYNNYLKYKGQKAQDSMERGNLENSLTQANNNQAITKEQAPLVPQQAADSFAARGVGQSTFGNGTGDQWAQNIQGTPPNPNPQYANPSSGAQTGPTQAGGPGSVGQYRLPVTVTPPAQSGASEPVGTGLQRAQDLSKAMVSNANSQQAAAQNAVDQFQKVIKSHRRQYYSGVAQDVVNAILGMMI